MKTDKYGFPYLAFTNINPFDGKYSEVIGHIEKQHHRLCRCEDDRIFCKCNPHKIFGKYRFDSLPQALEHIKQVDPNYRDQYESRIGNKINRLTKWDRLSPTILNQTYSRGTLKMLKIGFALNKLSDGLAKNLGFANQHFLRSSGVGRIAEIKDFNNLKKIYFLVGKIISLVSKMR